MAVSVVNTNTSTVPSAALGQAQGSSVVRASLGPPVSPVRQEKPPPWPPRPAGDRSSPRKARAAQEAAGERTLHPGRRCRFLSHRPKHSSDRFRQVGGGERKYSPQPRKVTRGRGVRRKVKRRTSPNAACRGTPGAGHAGPGAPGHGCPRLQSGTRAPASRPPHPPRACTTFSSRGPAAGARTRRGGRRDRGRTHLRRSAPGRRVAAAAATAGAG